MSAPTKAALRRESEKARNMASRFLEELVALRQAAATHLRYIDGEVIDGLRSGRHTREVVANIAQHQSQNLRRAIERTGKLTREGTADYSVNIRDLPTPGDDGGDERA